MTAWLKEYVEGLSIAPEGRLRMDCPACNKKNTFSVSDTGGERLWFCFHADCNVRGRTGFRIRKEAAYHPLLSKVKHKQLIIYVIIFYIEYIRILFSKKLVKIFPKSCTNYSKIEIEFNSTYDVITSCL